MNMDKEIINQGIKVSKVIEQMAAQSLNNKLQSAEAIRSVKRQQARPVDYMRYAEFDAVIRYLDIQAGDQILDISSPQWFTLYLAQTYPDATFVYLNIVAEEIVLFDEVKNSLGLKNLSYQLGDVRQLKFKDNSFDKAISISVIEHVYPEKGGDVQALLEIKRVLKNDGDILITVPCKDKRNIVYVDAAVYERDQSKNNFFSREYDIPMFDEMVKDSGLNMIDKMFICEKKGLLAMDLFEWGPPSNKLTRFIIKARRIVDIVFGHAVDRRLAKKYLRVLPNVKHRLVNIFAIMKKTGLN